MFKKIKKKPSKINFKIAVLILLLFIVIPFQANAIDILGTILSPLSIIAYIFSTIAGLLLMFAGWVFTWSVDLVSNSENIAVINVGWDVSLGFVNMFFILALLAIAIATILGEDIAGGWTYKKVLPKFLIVILLVNFSKVIGTTIIGFTNDFTHFFLAGILGNKGGSIAINMMNVFSISQIDATINESMLKSAISAASNFLSFDGFLGQITNLIARLVALFTMLAGVVYMIKRTFHIWLLLMVAPFAWFAYIFPQTKKYWDEWWDKFIKWSIFPIVYLFFLYLAFQISAVLRKGGIVSPEVNKYTGPIILEKVFGVSGVTNGVGQILGIAVFAFLSIMGIVAANKLGVGGSNFVMNYAKKMKGAASKKFSSLRAKGPLSAEKLGAKFGGMGAGLLAKSRIGGVIGLGKETREQLRQEQLEGQQKRENIDNARLKLKNFREGQSDTHKNLEKAKRAEDQGAIKILTSKLRNEEIDLLKEIRKGTAEGKPKYSMDDIEKFIKAQGQGGAPAPATPKP